MNSLREAIVNSNPQSTRSMEGHGIYVELRFSATYTKVSNEHDDDFQDRMGIIFTFVRSFHTLIISCCKSNRLGRFGGLFSAVNFTFIIRMQPNPRDPLYVLILQLIESH
jgi:hypothetical protein